MYSFDSVCVSFPCAVFRPAFVIDCIASLSVPNFFLFFQFDPQDSSCRPVFTSVSYVPSGPALVRRPASTFGTESTSVP